MYFCSSRTSRSWWIIQSTQHHRRGCNSRLPTARNRGQLVCEDMFLSCTYAWDGVKRAYKIKDFIEPLPGTWNFTTVGYPWKNPELPLWKKYSRPLCHQRSVWVITACFSHKCVCCAARYLAPVTFWSSSESNNLGKTYFPVFLLVTVCILIYIHFRP